MVWGADQAFPQELPDYRSPATLRNEVADTRLYRQNLVSLQLVTGALVSPVGIGPDTDTFNYTMTNLRLGWMMNTPALDGHPLDGAVEFLFELSGSAVFEGAGSFLSGPTLLLRYHFTQPDWRWVPYIQLGGGITFTDAYEDRSQRAIGQQMEFTPQASLGSRYLIDPNWSLDIEFIYHHISNAGLAERNLGINALGGLAGLTYFFNP
ncbi:MAG: acyloxyacyl hydrolase [Candidatus Methylacidiphilales bacterium]